MPVSSGPPRDMMLYMEQLVSSDNISGRMQARIWGKYVFWRQTSLIPILQVFGYFLNL